MQAVYLSKPNAFLRYHDLPGEDPVRVYLHGLAVASAPFYAHVVTRSPLSHRRSLLVDLLGFGYSDRPEDFSYTAEDHAEAVITLLDQLRIRSCELVGHSVGGSIAILVATRRPDLIARLAVAEANLDPVPGFFTGMVIKFSEADYVDRGYAEILAALHKEAREGEGERPTVFAGTYQVSASWAIHRTARSIVGPRAPTFREQFIDLKLPRAFIIGSKNVEGDPDRTESLVTAGIPRFIVPGAGHGMAWDNPDGFALAIEEAFRAG